MEPSKDAISVRIGRLNNHMLSKQQCIKDNEKSVILTREGLFDALQILYDECNCESLKSSDKNIGTFVDKYRKIIIELKKLRVNLSDFETRNVIGRGRFGEVHVVKERQSGDVYAMKTVRKYENSDKKSVFEEERNIMAFSNSPWITKLHYAFQDNTNLYFIMEYHPGGDLVGLLYRQGGTLPESAATFYIAELIFAINELHEMGYVHRDIKPDNVLLDRCGHLKLADFGSAAKLNEKGALMFGIPVGTPDYIAPEALQSLDNNKVGKIPYTKSCDYWSVGILAYELTIGTTPFNGSSSTLTFSKIINHSKSLKFPPDISLTQGYILFIKGLLTDENNRLTFDQIIKHPIFKTSNFNDLRDQVPPFVPKISSCDDTSNFSGLEAKKRQPYMENFKSRTQFNGRNLPFIGFTYAVEPQEHKENYRASLSIKNDIVEGLRMEIEMLQRKLIKHDDVEQEKESLERKFEERARKLESIQSVRDKLEQDLANQISECQGVKRTLDMERKHRSDLERKALDLIKCAKSKWEVSEKTKLDHLNSELEESRQKCAKLQTDIETLNRKLQEAVNASIKNKASVENVEKLRRSSVVGLESRLEKVTADLQDKMSFLQNQLALETRGKKDVQKKLEESENKKLTLQNNLDDSQKSLKELQMKCTELTNTVKKLEDANKILKQESENSQKYKDLIKILEEQINDLRADNSKNELQREIDNSLVLKKQIKDLKGELNSLRASKLSSAEDIKSKYELNIKELEQKLKSMRAERNEIDFKYQEILINMQNKDEKANTLEQLLLKLQEDLAKLESGSERETVLQEQIERSEHQLLEMSENAALQRQELTQLKTKHWRMEKELSNAELDKKIVERDLKEEEAKNKELQKEIEQLNAKYENGKSIKESAILELSQLNEKLYDDIIGLKVEIKNLQNLLSGVRNTEAEKDKENNKLLHTVQEKEFQICNILKQFDDVKNEKSSLEKQIDELQNQNSKLNDMISVKTKDKEIIANKLENTNQELENSLLNRKALREACTVLESQLIEFETILETTESKRDQLETEIQTLKSKLSADKSDILNARKAMNEEKSLRILAETKFKRLTDDFENLQKELDSYKKECFEFKSYSNELSDELTASEQKVSQNELSIKSLERQIEDYLAENNYLKEENSEQLTFINNVKESNYKLGKHLNESQTHNKALINKIGELEDLINEKVQYYKERDLKANATIQQQIKLIDYLQSMIEDGNKKKKTLTDKLFGHSKKENVSPISMVLNYKDLELKLNKEKDENKKLQQELIKLKTDTYDKNYCLLKNKSIKASRVQDEIISQIVQSPSSQKKDLNRQNSVPRMHHNIPHRFESKLCTKVTECFHCSNPIILGKNIALCKECNVMVHPSCQSLLPRTCGLPNALLKHYSDSLSRISNSNEKVEDEEIKMEGWVKIPVGSKGWEKHYACLTNTALNIYNEPPNGALIKTVQNLQLKEKESGKVVLEPLPSEIGKPVANSDLPFVIKVVTNPNTTCWPSQCIIFMTLSIEDREKWFKALNNIFKINDKNSGDIIYMNNDCLEINCYSELNNDIKLLGTETGLYSIHRDGLLHILGPLSVYDIIILKEVNIVLMIVDEMRVLITCDLKHLISLAQYSPCTKPTLKFQTLQINNLDGFHIIKESNFTFNKCVCVATPKQLIILKYDLVAEELIPQRILDTAEPVSCIHFTPHSVIIGADKFFEVDLKTFQADEFLDSSDLNLKHVIKCYKMKSFPVSIQEISKCEYLLCFNEFAIFVDQYGRSSRKNDLTWNHLPRAFHYSKHYLYVIQYNAVEIYKINESSCNLEQPRFIRIELINPQYLGCNENGVYVFCDKQIKYINAKEVDEEASILSESTDQNEDGFSFTSSMVQSLDGNLSDTDSEAPRENNLKPTEAVRYTKISDL